jgi:hypothetical protein
VFISYTISVFAAIGFKLTTVGSNQWNRGRVLAALLVGPTTFCIQVVLSESEALDQPMI